MVVVLFILYGIQINFTKTFICYKEDVAKFPSFLNPQPLHSFQSSENPVIPKNGIETPNCLFWLKQLQKAQGGLNFLGKGVFVNTIKGTMDPNVELCFTQVTFFKS